MPCPEPSGDAMRRREFITARRCGGSVAARGARAAAGDAGDRVPQQRIACRAVRPCWPRSARGLSETGYVEGQNVAIEYRWAEGQNDRLPAMAADLVRRQVAVIAAPALLRHLRQRRRPRRFRSSSNRRRSGPARTRRQPEPAGRQRHGRDPIEREVAPKRLELLHELVPTATVIALLVNPTDPNCRANRTRTPGGGSHPRAAAPCPECQHRTRLRYGLRKLGPIASGRARDRHRCILQ